MTDLLPTLGWAYLADDSVNSGEQVVSEALGRAAALENRPALMEVHRVRACCMARRSNRVK